MLISKKMYKINLFGTSKCLCLLFEEIKLFNLKKKL